MRQFTRLITEEASDFLDNQISKIIKPRLDSNINEYTSYDIDFQGVEDNILTFTIDVDDIENDDYYSDGNAGIFITETIVRINGDALDGFMEQLAEDIMGELEHYFKSYEYEMLEKWTFEYRFELQEGVERQVKSGLWNLNTKK